MSAQGIIVTLLVVLAAAYVFRRLAPRRWLWRIGIGRSGRGAGTGGANAGGGACGCDDCPASPKPRRIER